jgi:hypothetical protein
MGWGGLCAEEKLLTFPRFVKYVYVLDAIPTCFFPCRNGVGLLEDVHAANDR